MSTKKFLMGMIVGGLVSGFATLLTTPRSGVDLRKNLSRSEEEWAQMLTSLKEAILEVSRDISSVTKEGRIALSTFISDVKISVQAWKEATADNQGVIKAELDSIQRTLAKLENDLQQK